MRDQRAEIQLGEDAFKRDGIPPIFFVRIGYTMRVLEICKFQSGTGENYRNIIFQNLCDNAHYDNFF
jgi:hypothetical protein